VRILLFASAYNGMCQRMHRELEADNHQIAIELSANEQDMNNTVSQFQPNLIICPFLKHRVPENIWREHLCLIVHPGIEGDRGPSSLDWAINAQLSHWGVTVLQAAEEMDAGDIWGTQNFALRNTAKASVYRREVIATAVQLVKQILADLKYKPHFAPRPLDYSNADVKGECLPLMRQNSRQINWSRDNTATITQKINAADSFPGVLDDIAGNSVYLYGARAEYSLYNAEPGELVGHRDGAICRATIDGSVWIRQMKLAAQDEKIFFKLPALHVVTQQFINTEKFHNLGALDSRVQNDIHVEVNNAVAYVHFDFYNGAMNTEQCMALQSHLRELKARSDIRVIALLGGEDFWSNGIHLNCIESAQNPARESWRNINAIDDVIHEILTTHNKLTVAALRSNAGAGGAIMPLACDKICARNGVVLNPHYLTMGLYGSEYWTYLLPKRVGAETAQELISGCMPLLASRALEIGYVDTLFAEDWGLYHQALQLECEELATDAFFIPLLKQKNQRREMDEAIQPLASYRAAELRNMKLTFDDPHSDYHKLRNNFVYKISCGKTPARLSYKPATEKLLQQA
jgi:putative two-component system protein, hydrogenase maturation factor HypX/HoxX